MIKKIAGALAGMAMVAGGVVGFSAADVPVAAATTTHQQVKLPNRCLVHGRVLCADKTRHMLYYVHNGTVERTMTAAFGRPGYHTREGTFHVQRKARHWVSTIYHSAMPDAMFFSGGQAVHYSHSYWIDKHHQSHGCVNIRQLKALNYVFSQIRVGDRVVVYRS